MSIQSDYPMLVLVCLAAQKDLTKAQTGLSAAVFTLGLWARISKKPHKLRIWV